MKLISSNVKLETERDFRPSGKKSELFADHFTGQMIFEFEPKELDKLSKSQYGRDDWMKQAAEKWADERLKGDHDYQKGAVSFQSKVIGNRVVVKPFVEDADKFSLNENESLTLKSVLRQSRKRITRVSV